MLYGDKYSEGPLFSQAILDHVWNPRNSGALKGATHHGLAGIPGDGAYALVWLAIQDDVIRLGSYETYGCPAAIASCSSLIERLIGASVDEAAFVTSAEVTMLLGGLPEGKEHCAELAVEALRSALKNPLEND